MPTLLQQLGRSYYAECGSGSDCDAQTSTNHSAQQQSQQQQREREQQRDQRRDRDRDREREREHLHQLQSITNLLLDLPSASSPSSYLPSRAREGSCQRTPGGSITDGDMSISDLFGLGLPRGSLMGGSSGGAGGNGGGSGQTAIGSPGGYRNHHQYHSNTPSLSNHPTHHLHQYDDGYGYPATSTSVDTPGSPNSVTTPGSPGTPGSTYFNPYTFVPTVSSGTQSTPSPSGRNMQLQLIGSPTSPIHSPYYGRAILGSPSYSDCGSPTPDYNTMMGCSGSRSNSPADSETSGISSMDESMSDIMYCLTLNSGSHPRHPENVGSLMSPEADLLSSSGRTASFQRMTNKKYLPQHQSVHQHSHNHIRNHQYAPNQTKNYLSSFWDFEKNQTAPNQSRNYLGSFWESEKKNSCLGINSHVMSVNPSVPNTSEQQTSLDRAARFHRNAASLYDATCTWSGLLPQRTQDPLGYSSKVFLGGVPWDITESLLISTFKQFGQIRIEWPGKEPSATQPKGYVYIIFESEKQVKALLASCTHDFTNGGSWYYKISSKRTKGKEVEVIPWVLNDSNYVKSSSQKLDPQKTVFVGALHGMLTAKGLAKIMNDLFEEVIYAGIDTDKYKYPIGSARVTFSSTRSYFKAITAAFIEIKTAKFTKKVQVEPYLEDSLCSSCFVQQGPYFCRELVCFRYFCRSCWQWQHAMESMRHHKPRMRSTKTHRMVGLSSGAVLNNVGSRTSNILTI